MEQESKKRFIINVVFFILAATLVWLASRFLLGYLLPFVLGTALAFAVQRPARLLSSKLGMPTGVWAAILVGLLFSVGVGLVGFGLFKLITQSVSLLSSIPQSLEGANGFMQRAEELLLRVRDTLPKGASMAFLDTLEGMLGDFISSLTAYISSAATSLAAAAPKFLLSFVVTVAASCYIAKDFDRLTKFLRSLIKKETYKRMIIIKNIFVGCVLRMVCGYGILALITFAELSVAFFLLKIKYSILIAAVIAFVDLLPVLGSGTVLIPWAAVCMLGGNVPKGVILCVIYLVITAVRYFAQPRIIAGQTGADPLLTLLAVFLGFRLGGVGGMLLFPVVCIVVIEYYKRQLKEETNIHNAETDA